MQRQLVVPNVLRKHNKTVSLRPVFLNSQYDHFRSPEKSNKEFGGVCFLTMVQKDSYVIVRVIEQPMKIIYTKILNPFQCGVIQGTETLLYRDKCHQHFVISCALSSCLTSSIGDMRHSRCGVWRQHFTKEGDRFRQH